MATASKLPSYTRWFKSHNFMALAHIVRPLQRNSRDWWWRFSAAQEAGDRYTIAVINLRDGNGTYAGSIEATIVDDQLAVTLGDHGQPTPAAVDAWQWLCAELGRAVGEAEPAPAEPPTEPPPANWPAIETIALDYEERGHQYLDQQAFAKAHAITRNTLSQYLSTYERVTGKQIRPGRGRSKRYTKATGRKR